LVNLNGVRAGDDDAARRRVFERARDSVARVPGVAAASLSIVTPVQGGGISDQIEVSGGLRVAPALLGGIANAFSNVASPEWFGTIGMTLVGGRDFRAEDQHGAPRVAIVNQALVRMFLNGADPIGHTLKHLRGTSAEIVGVVADAVYGSLREAPVPHSISRWCKRTSRPAR
jgi:hypothetical protein